MITKIKALYYVISLVVYVIIQHLLQEFFRWTDTKSALVVSLLLFFNLENNSLSFPLRIMMLIMGYIIIAFAMYHVINRLFHKGNSR